MLYGTPTRATHRATAGGGLALIARATWSYGRRGAPGPLRGVGGTGQHRLPARRRPQRAAQLLVQALAALIVLGVTTLIGYFIVADAQRGGAAPTIPDESGALASRTVDGDPLTLQEIFPDSKVVRAPAAPSAYRITMTHADNDCRTAVTGDLGALLAQHGCSQVVRAGLSAPYGDYQVTAGVFNLADALGAQDVDGRLRRLVETGDGNFATLPAGAAGPEALATLQVGWDARGHYLLYCVITRPDGKLVTSDDPYAQLITTDLVDAYLADTLQRRAGG